MNHPGLLDILSFSSGGWGPAIATGAVMTVLIAVAGFLIGAVIGTFGAWAKIAGGPVIRAVADGYTTILRGIPDLLVIYLFYFGGSAAVTAVGRWFGADGFIGFPGFLAGALRRGRHVGRAAHRGVQGRVPGGSSWRAGSSAIACGMSRWLRFRRIVVPLTLRHALPGLGNVWQVVLKESALVSVTGVVELMRQSQIGAGSTGLPFDFYTIAAGVYLAISTVSGLMLQSAERRFSRGTRRV